MEIVLPYGLANSYHFECCARRIGFDEFVTRKIIHVFRDSDVDVYPLMSDERLTLLLYGWQLCDKYIKSQNNVVDEAAFFLLRYLSLFSLRTWLSREWQKCPHTRKAGLIFCFDRAQEYLAGKHNLKIDNWKYLMKLNVNPWQHPYLFKILAPEPEQTESPFLSEDLEDKATHEDVQYVKEEGLILITLRLIQLFDTHSLQAVKKLAVRAIVAWHAVKEIEGAKGDISSRDKDCLLLICHIYLMAIYESDSTDGNLIDYMIHNIKFYFKYLQQYETNVHVKYTPASYIALTCNSLSISISGFLRFIITRGFDDCLTTVFGTTMQAYKSYVLGNLLMQLNALNEVEFKLHVNEYKQLVDKYIDTREKSETFLLNEIKKLEKQSTSHNCPHTVRLNVNWKTNICKGNRLLREDDDILDNADRRIDPIFQHMPNNLEVLMYTYKTLSYRPYKGWHFAKLVLLLKIVNRKLNSIESWRYHLGLKPEFMIELEQKISCHFEDLAKIFHEHPFIEQELWLTAFYLYPKEPYFDAVTRCGTRFRKIQSNKENYQKQAKLKNEKLPMNFINAKYGLLSCTVDAETMLQMSSHDGPDRDYQDLRQALRDIKLPDSLINDLLIATFVPRNRLFSWAVQWSELRRRCKEYLKNTSIKRRFVELNMADANKRLKFLKIDYEKYKNRPQIDYGSIEKGYEDCAVFEEDDDDDTDFDDYESDDEPKAKKKLGRPKGSRITFGEKKKATSPIHFIPESAFENVRRTRARVAAVIEAQHEEKSSGTELSNDSTNSTSSATQSQTNSSSLIGVNATPNAASTSITTATPTATTSSATCEIANTTEATSMSASTSVPSSSTSIAGGVTSNAQQMLQPQEKIFKNSTAGFPKFLDIWRKPFNTSYSKDLLPGKKVINTFKHLEILNEIKKLNDKLKSLDKIIVENKEKEKQLEASKETPQEPNVSLEPKDDLKEPKEQRDLKEPEESSKSTELNKLKEQNHQSSKEPEGFKDLNESKADSKVIGISAESHKIPNKLNVSKDSEENLGNNEAMEIDNEVDEAMETDNEVNVAMETDNDVDVQEIVEIEMKSLNAADEITKTSLVITNATQHIEGAKVAKEKESFIEKGQIQEVVVVMVRNEEKMECQNIENQVNQVKECISDASHQQTAKDTTEVIKDIGKKTETTDPTTLPQAAIAVPEGIDETSTSGLLLTKASSPTTTEIDFTSFEANLSEDLDESDRSDYSTTALKDSEEVDDVACSPQQASPFPEDSNPNLNLFDESDVISARPLSTLSPTGTNPTDLIKSNKLQMDGQETKAFAIIQEVNQQVEKTIRLVEEVKEAQTKEHLKTQKMALAAVKDSEAQNLVEISEKTEEIKQTKVANESISSEREMSSIDHKNNDEINKPDEKETTLEKPNEEENNGKPQTNPHPQIQPQPQPEVKNITEYVEPGPNPEPQAHLEVKNETKKEEPGTKSKPQPHLEVKNVTKKVESGSKPGPNPEPQAHLEIKNETKKEESEPKSKPQPHLEVKNVTEKVECGSTPGRNPEPKAHLDVKNIAENVESGSKSEPHLEVKNATENKEPGSKPRPKSELQPHLEVKNPTENKEPGSKPGPKAEPQPHLEVKNATENKEPASKPGPKPQLHLEVKNPTENKEPGSKPGPKAEPQPHLEVENATENKESGSKPGPESEPQLHIELKNETENDEPGLKSELQPEIKNKIKNPKPGPQLQLEVMNKIENAQPAPSLGPKPEPQLQPEVKSKTENDEDTTKSGPKSEPQLPLPLPLEVINKIKKDEPVPSSQLKSELQPDFEAKIETKNDEPQSRLNLEVIDKVEKDKLGPRPGLKSESQAQLEVSNKTKNDKPETQSHLEVKYITKNDESGPKPDPQAQQESDVKNITKNDERGAKSESAPHLEVRNKTENDEPGPQSHLEVKNITKNDGVGAKSELQSQAEVKNKSINDEADSKPGPKTEPRPHSEVKIETKNVESEFKSEPQLQPEVKNKAKNDDPGPNPGHKSKHQPQLEDKNETINDKPEPESELLPQSEVKNKAPDPAVKNATKPEPISKAPESTSKNPTQAPQPAVKNVTQSDISLKAPDPLVKNANQPEISSEAPVPALTNATPPDISLKAPEPAVKNANQPEISFKAPDPVVKNANQPEISFEAPVLAVKNATLPDISLKATELAVKNGTQSDISFKAPDLVVKDASQPEISFKAPEPAVKKATKPETTSKAPEPAVTNAAQPAISLKASEPVVKNAAQPAISLKASESVVKNATQPETSFKTPEPAVKSTTRPDISFKASEPVVKNTTQPQIIFKAPHPAVKNVTQPDIRFKAPDPVVKNTNQPDISFEAPVPAVTNATLPDISLKAPDPVVKTATQPEISFKAPDPVVKNATLPEISFKAPDPVVKDATQPEISFKAPDPVVKDETQPQLTFKTPESSVKNATLPEINLKAPEPAVKNATHPETSFKAPEPAVENATQPASSFKAADSVVKDATQTAISFRAANPALKCAIPPEISCKVSDPVLKNAIQLQGTFKAPDPAVKNAILPQISFRAPEPASWNATLQQINFKAPGHEFKNETKPEITFKAPDPFKLPFYPLDRRNSMASIPIESPFKSYSPIPTEIRPPVSFPSPFRRDGEGLSPLSSSSSAFNSIISALNAKAMNSLNRQKQIESLAKIPKMADFNIKPRVLLPSSIIDPDDIPSTSQAAYLRRIVQEKVFISLAKPETLETQYQELYQQNQCRKVCPVHFIKKKTYIMYKKLIAASKQQKKRHVLMHRKKLQKLIKNKFTKNNIQKEKTKRMQAILENLKNKNKNRKQQTIIIPEKSEELESLQNENPSSDPIERATEAGTETENPSSDPIKIATELETETGNKNPSSDPIEIATEIGTGTEYPSSDPIEIATEIGTGAENPSSDPIEIATEIGTGTENPSADPIEIATEIRTGTEYLSSDPIEIATGTGTEYPLYDPIDIATEAETESGTDSPQLTIDLKDEEESNIASPNQEQKENEFENQNQNQDQDQNLEFLTPSVQNSILKDGQFSKFLNPSLKLNEADETPALTESIPKKDSSLKVSSSEISTSSTSVGFRKIKKSVTFLDLPIEKDDENMSEKVTTTWTKTKTKANNQTKKGKALYPSKSSGKGKKVSSSTKSNKALLNPETPNSTTSPSSLSSSGSGSGSVSSTTSSSSSSSPSLFISTDEQESIPNKQVPLGKPLKIMNIVNNDESTVCAKHHLFDQHCQDECPKKGFCCRFPMSFKKALDSDLTPQSRSFGTFAMKPEPLVAQPVAHVAPNGDKNSLKITIKLSSTDTPKCSIIEQQEKQKSKVESYRQFLENLKQECVDRQASVLLHPLKAKDLIHLRQPRVLLKRWRPPHEATNGSGGKRSREINNESGDDEENQIHHKLRRSRRSTSACSNLSELLRVKRKSITSSDSENLDIILPRKLRRRRYPREQNNEEPSTFSPSPSSKRNLVVTPRSASGLKLRISSVTGERTETTVQFTISSRSSSPSGSTGASISTNSTVLNSPNVLAARNESTTPPVILTSPFTRRTRRATTLATFRMTDSEDNPVSINQFTKLNKSDHPLYEEEISC